MGDGVWRIEGVSERLAKVSQRKHGEDTDELSPTQRQERTQETARILAAANVQLRTNADRGNAGSAGNPTVVEAGTGNGGELGAVSRSLPAAILAQLERIFGVRILLGRVVDGWCIHITTRGRHPNMVVAMAASASPQTG